MYIYVFIYIINRSLQYRCLPQKRPILAELFCKRDHKHHPHLNNCRVANYHVQGGEDAQDVRSCRKEPVIIGFFCGK